jgi:hypothetical protein
MKRKYMPGIKKKIMPSIIKKNSKTLKPRIFQKDLKVCFKANLKLISGLFKI